MMLPFGKKIELVSLHVILKLPESLFFGINVKTFQDAILINFMLDREHKALLVSV